MLKLKNMTIGQKLTAIITLTSMSLLFCGITAYLVLNTIDSARLLIKDIDTQAAMTAENCKASVAFSDRKDAERVLSSLRFQNSIVYACIFDSQGRIFAEHRNADSYGEVESPVLRAAGHYFEKGHLSLYKPIQLDGELIGTIYLHNNLRPLYKELARGLLTAVGILIVISAAGYYLSNRLQRIISGPILELAEVAKSVSEKHQYALRAARRSNDEVGALVDAFNIMLGQIQQRDMAIVKTNEQLELRVQERIAELRNSLSLLNATLDSTADGILVVDRNGKVTRYNNKFLEMWRIPKSLAESGDDEKLLNYVLEQLKYPQKFIDKVKELYAKPDVEDMDTLEFIDGRAFERYSCPQVIDKQIIGRVWNFHNITERKIAEQAQHRLNEELKSTIHELTCSNRQLREFAHITAHDLKSPVRAIGILTCWLRTDYADKFDKEGKEKAELIVAKAEQLSEQIESVLDYSEIGYNTQRFEKVDLQELIAKATADIAPPENIEILVPDKLPVLYCEKSRMVQVFRNLLDNAVKYMDKPKGLIRIGCTEEDNFLRFSITDNGPGIDAKYFDKIFKLFQTLSTDDKNRGAGMGLATVEKIVETYGGAVRVESKVEEGTTFFFTLPKTLVCSDELCRCG